MDEKEILKRLISDEGYTIVDRGSGPYLYEKRIHYRDNKSWKLSVRILEDMRERGLLRIVEGNFSYEYVLLNKKEKIL